MWMDANGRYIDTCKISGNINLANTSVRVGVNIAGLNEFTNQQALLYITQPSNLMIGPSSFLLLRKCWAAQLFAPWPVLA